MRVYLAAPWSYRSSAAVEASKLEKAGHVITEPWWHHQDVNGDDSASDELLLQARKDLAGINNADVFVLLNLAKSEGKAVEMGIALAYQMPIFAVGKRGEHSANVFHYLPQVQWFGSVEEVIDELA